MTARLFVLTGAGALAESGLCTFRDAGGRLMLRLDRGISPPGKVAPFGHGMMRMVCHPRHEGRAP